MSSPEETFEGQLPHIAAAQKAAELVNPGNELQESAAAQIMQIAFEADLKRAFPEDVRLTIED